MTGPTISRHLRTLREAGLVDAERRGTLVYFRARPQILRQLAGLLSSEPAAAAQRQATAVPDGVSCSRATSRSMPA